jgi:hypothetical protein
MTTYKEYLTWNYDKLEAEYTRQGFYSLTAFLLAQKNKTNVIKKSNKHKVKVSDIKSGHCVGFTKEGHSIIAGKKQTKGIIKIYYAIHDPKLYTPLVTKNFSSVKLMVDEINTILDEEKTEELAWW